ncbi:MAG TPA: MarR family transcriptional regulator [Candidatus Dormibacteraeota bacterium]|jgi:DNA-binding MarR family transcriptional regulator|nr:MarR family transcriptional regulator [Candidatus Dormibacteraeota bacterium]
MPEDHVDRTLRLWAAERPDLDTSPAALVARVGRASLFLDRGIEVLLRRHGLNRPSWDVLATLRRVGAPHRLTPTEIYRQVMRTSGVMTRRIDTLEAMGLVRRIPDPNDRRGVLVELLPAGLRLVDDVVGLHLENERRLLTALSAADQRILIGLLRKLLLNLEGEPADDMR